jgi:peptide/nickel transport system substrate-binding protein
MKRRDVLGTGIMAIPAGYLAMRGIGPAFAQSRAETLRVLSDGVPNTFDPAGAGANRDANGFSWNVYARLLRFSRYPVAGEIYHYDYYTLEGEVAERWEVSPDGTSITFHIRRDATFHDGTPITAEDVKWSLDRVVSMPASARQMSTGSMTSPDQFVIVDDHTVRVDFEQEDRFALPNLAITFPAIINAKVARRHASDADPWAAEWLKENVAGSGAYMLESFTAGQQIAFARHDGWRCGPMPALRRVIHQLVPAASSRALAVERGDADIAVGIPPHELERLEGRPGVRIASVPMRNAFQFIGMNNDREPFDDVNVRLAIAHALPYQAMFEGVMRGRGRPLHGGTEWVPTSAEWPAPQPYATDLAKARAYMAKSKVPNGFATTFTFNIADEAVAEPLSILIQEALAEIGIAIEISKVPNAQMGTLLTEKTIPFFFDISVAWLNDPDYFFRIFYSGDWRWNYGSFRNAEVDRLLAEVRFERDAAVYEAKVKRIIEIVYAQCPIILLWQPSHDMPMRDDLRGYTYYFHRQVDYRVLTRA